MKLDTSPLAEWVVILVRGLPFAAMLVVVAYALVLIIIDVKKTASKSAKEMKERILHYLLNLSISKDIDSVLKEIKFKTGLSKEVIFTFFDLDFCPLISF